MSNSLDIIPLRRREPLRISTDIPLLAKRSHSPPSSSPPTNQNTTPRSTSTTGIPHCPFHVLCMHDFESLDPDHLPFYKDEVLIVIKQEHSGWWAAMRPHEDRVGWIPSLFVLPLDCSKTLGHADKRSALWRHDSLNDHPLSAVHDPCVPVSEDCAALSFRLVTPTDLVPYQGFFGDRPRNLNHEPISILPDDDQFFNIDDVFHPPTPRRLPPHGVKTLYPLSFLLSESKALPTRPASQSMFDMVLHHHTCSCKVNDQTSFSHCISPASPQTTSSLDAEGSIVALKPTFVSQDVADSDGWIDGQSQHVGAPTSFYPIDPNKGTADIKSLDLTSRNPDSLARQLCVLMHTLYASIRQNHCLDWIRGRRSTEVTGLRHFFDIHDDIASWVQRSIPVDDDLTQQTEAILEFWVRVAEACRSFQNFDSLGAIILALSSSSSSFGPAWTRCTSKQTFTTLRDMLDATDSFKGMMDAIRGPAVPFVRRHLEDIKGLYPEQHSNLPRQSKGPGSSTAVCKMRLAAITTLLRHQSLPYDFETTKSTDEAPIRTFSPIDCKLAGSRNREHG